MFSRYGLIAASVLISGSIFATPITGRLGMDGKTTVGDSLTTIDFNYNNPGCVTISCTPPPAASSATIGNFTVGNVSTGSFLGLIGNAGTVHSFDISQAPPGVDIGHAFPNFITISGLPNVIFYLREVNVGSFGTAGCGGTGAPGDTCTPVLPGNVKSPLELSNSIGPNSHAQFSVVVDALNTVTNELSVGVGTFSTDFAGTFFQPLLNDALAGKVITTGYHGDFTLVFTAVPEPSTTAFAGIGTALLGIGSLIGRRRKAAASQTKS